jgi:hypothetical protein
LNGKGLIETHLLSQRLHGLWCGVDTSEYLRGIARNHTYEAEDRDRCQNDYRQRLRNALKNEAQLNLPSGSVLADALEMFSSPPAEQCRILALSRPAALSFIRPAFRLRGLRRAIPLRGLSR